MTNLLYCLGRLLIRKNNPAKIYPFFNIIKNRSLYCALQLSSTRKSSSFKCIPFIMSSNIEITPDSMLENGLSKLITNTVFVTTNDNALKISLFYPPNISGRIFNLTREIDSSLENSITRLKLNIASKTSNKPKKIKIDPNDISIKLLRGEVELDGSTLIEDSWTEETALVINEFRYEIKKDCPLVLEIRLPKVLLSGFPLIYRLIMSNCTHAQSKVYWYRVITAAEMKSLTPDLEKKVIRYDNMIWLLLSTELEYMPVEDDVSHKLILQCLPFDGQRQGPVSYCSTLPVSPGIDNWTILDRHKQTHSFLNEDSQFRVVSYNILADLYTDQKYSREVLFKHCPRQYLDLNYRRQLLVREIEGYKSDILCLQEVDKKEFNYSYTPYFSKRNYDCVFAEKGKTSEGLMIMLNKSKFSLVNSHQIKLSNLVDQNYHGQTSNVDGDLESDIKEVEEREDSDHFILRGTNTDTCKALLKSFDDVRNAIDGNELCKRALCERKTTLQVALVRIKGKNDYLLIANTHLYFAPGADDIRMLQGYICLKYIEFMKKYYLSDLCASTDSKPQINVILCGDMNSSPDCALYKLITEGSVPSDFKDWTSCEQRSINGFNLNTSLRFRPAYENIDYTNYTPLFNGCLDYIYFEVESMSCTKVVPLPDHDTVIKTGGIPSDQFPSDHLALVAEIMIKDKSM